MTAAQNAFIELLRKRRSVREFLPRAIEPVKIEVLKEAVLRSPSSRNFDPWEFVFVMDREKLKTLSRLKRHGSEFLAQAALAIAVCGDESKSDVWVEDCAIASILALLAAQSLGLGGCWVQVRKRFYDDGSDSEEYVRRTLALPSNLRVLSVMGIGYPAEFPEPLAEQELKRDHIHLNDF
ncbi:MAG: nitroreductase family protein [Planctomycetaceae bacterium]|nr:nitroreductase family protein [Planctomycetaceae bacterium]